ncbi:hypothetical protein GCM10009564_01440 [Streptomyces thermogriseus]|uniref:Uncharacterized protein n=1 Tax=Streptomyces thermogriseus TaxID=75292 RepID=A0ABN1SR51_9ACTN
MARSEGQPEAPQHQSAQKAGDRDPHVVAVGTGESYGGHDTIQHAARTRRLMPRDGPGVHLSMYCEFIGDDDASGRDDREPGRVTERSEP